MGKCFFHGPECEVPGGDDEILLCEFCVEKMKHLVLVFCSSCGDAYFADPEFAREIIYADNPEKPEFEEWLRKMPILLIAECCSECRQETEAARTIQIFSGFEIKEGKVLL